MAKKVQTEHILQIFALQALVLLTHHEVILEHRQYNLGAAIFSLLRFLEGNSTRNFRALKRETTRLQKIPEITRDLLIRAAREHFAIPGATPRPVMNALSSSFMQLLRHTIPKSRVGRTNGRRIPVPEYREQAVLI